MSKCIRNGVTYKRHHWKDTVCQSCGLDVNQKQETLNGNQFLQPPNQGEILPNLPDAHVEVSTWEGEGGASQ
jgi:hypothetical protein